MKKKIVSCLLLISVLISAAGCTAHTEKSSTDDNTVESSMEVVAVSSKYYGDLEETTDENGRRGYILKTDTWTTFNKGDITDEFLTDFQAELLSIWSKCDYVSIDLGEKGGLSIAKAEDDLYFLEQYKFSLRTDFGDRYFYLTDYYNFKHIKTDNNMVTFEKASVFGQQHERDTKYNGSVSVLSFIRMIYGLKLEKVYHFDISSGFYSRFPGILLSEDEVMLFSGSLEIHKNPWWYNS